MTDQLGQMTNNITIYQTIEIPKQKDGSICSLKNLSKQQQAVVIAAIDTIVKFLKNDKKYKPL